MHRRACASARGPAGPIHADDDIRRAVLQLGRAEQILRGDFAAAAEGLVIFDVEGGHLRLGHAECSSTAPTSCRVTASGSARRGSPCASERGLAGRYGRSGRRSRCISSSSASVSTSRNVSRCVPAGMGGCRLNTAETNSLIAVVRVLRIIQRAVEVRRAVVKGRNRKPTSGAAATQSVPRSWNFLCGVIAQDGLCLLHGADAAEYIGKLLLAALFLPEAVWERTARHSGPQPAGSGSCPPDAESLRSFHTGACTASSSSRPESRSRMSRRCSSLVRDLRRRRAQVGERFAHSAGDAFFSSSRYFSCSPSGSRPMEG